MAEYKIKLDIYSGPLDLLLYLIRRNEVEIHDIPIALITEQYLEYVDLIEACHINSAAEFLVMASSLMEIKSAMLLPRHEAAEGEEDEDDLSDPRLELVHQLLEYKKYKDVAGSLGEQARQQSLRFPRSLANLNRLEEDEKRQQQEYDLEGLQIWDLFDAFNSLMKATFAGRTTHEVVHDDTPIDLYETDILDRAQKQVSLTFQDIFAACKTRAEMGGMFLALLELIRQKLVRIEQEETFGAIYIYPLTDEPAELAVAHAISADVDELPSHLIKDAKKNTEEAELMDDAETEKLTEASGDPEHERNQPTD